MQSKQEPYFRDLDARVLRFFGTGSKALGLALGPVSSPSDSSLLTEIRVVTRIPSSSASSFTCVASTFDSTLRVSVDWSWISVLGFNRSENDLRLAVNRTLCAQPASLPHSSLKWSPTASYVALFRVFCFPFPNL